MPFFRTPSLLFCILALGFSSTLQAHHDNDAAHSFVITGVVKNSNNDKLITDFTQYISKHSNYPLKVVYASNYTDLTRKMRNDPHAIGWTCGAPYVQDHKMFKQQLVAVPTFNQRPTYYSIVLTRNNRSEKTLADFKDGVLAYSDPRSNSGFLAPKYALFKKNINIEKHFRLLLNAGNHEGSIEALLNNLADVAAVDEYIWLAYIKENPETKKQLHEIERMGPYPFTPIVASEKVNKASIQKITNVLVNMQKDSQGKLILEKLALDSFVKKDHKFYTSINEMLKEVNIKTGM